MNKDLPNFAILGQQKLGRKKLADSTKMGKRLVSGITIG